MNKQETLKEAKLEHTKFCIENNIENPTFSFSKGAKWNQERSYSEEEVLELLNKSCDYIYDSSKIGTDKKLMPNLLRGWFEQFKKK